MKPTTGPRCLRCDKPRPELGPEYGRVRWLCPRCGRAYACAFGLTRPPTPGQLVIKWQTELPLGKVEPPPPADQWEADRRAIDDAYEWRKFCERSQLTPRVTRARKRA